MLCSKVDLPELLIPVIKFKDDSLNDSSLIDLKFLILNSVITFNP